MLFQKVVLGWVVICLATTTTTTRTCLAEEHQEEQGNVPNTMSTAASSKTKSSTTSTSTSTTTTTATTTTIAFGSCHKNKKATTPSIWDAIAAEHATAWVWTGDATYPSSRDPVTNKKRYGPASPAELAQGYQELKVNRTIGYTQMLDANTPIYGIWDDHDYGGNDMGQEMPLQKERRQTFWDFLGYQPDHHHPDDDQHDEDGMYHSIDLEGGKVQLIMLDTRWFRQDHCIPSVAHLVPMGNAIACATRWWTAGLYLHKWAWLWGMDGCERNSILGEEQWKWLENTLLSKNTQAKIHIIVSSIQVWSTNPAMESWGQFPHEQERLYRLLQTHYDNHDNTNNNHNNNSDKPPSDKHEKAKTAAPVVLWSGDVHHAEILGQPGYLEITSSGLTHHCGQPKLYGRMCQPILETFHQHRHERKDNFYIGLNYGVFQVDWEQNVWQVQIKNPQGETVLQISEQSLNATIELPPFEELPHTWNGHLIPWLQGVIVALVLAIAIARRLLRPEW